MICTAQCPRPGQRERRSGARSPADTKERVASGVEKEGREEGKGSKGGRFHLLLLLLLSVVASFVLLQQQSGDRDEGQMNRRRRRRWQA